MRARRRAIGGWAAAAFVYFFAVFNRASLGVAGIIAEHRFDVGPGALSVFVLLQVGVYAAMQVPTGVLVDRYGPRRLLIAAATIMAVAQLGFALVHSFPLALLARAVLGCGDALTFVSVLRYTAARFDKRRYPALVAATAMLGTVGNVGATAPLTALLNGPGWVASFLIAAAGSAVAAVGVLALVRDTAPSPRPLRRAEVTSGLRRVSTRVRDARALPGTRLGFWVHFVNTAAWATLALLWGHPYLVEGVHFSDAGASRLLMVSVIVAGVANPVVGVVTGRWPASRIPFSIATCAVSIAGLTALSAWPGASPPQALAAAVFALVMLGGPASMVAFAIARDYNPPRTLGTASGVVNVAGFLATVIATVLFGAVLDAAGGSTPHTMRLALLVLVGVEVLGGWRLAVWYRRVRAQARRRQAAGEPVPVRVGPRLWFDIRELEGPVVTPQELLEAQRLSTGGGRPR